MTTIITQSNKNDNRIEFDRVVSILTGQSNVISKIKNEIATVRNKYVSMLDVLSTYDTDKITETEKKFYDVQAMAFLHAIFMYLTCKDTKGKQYISPVSTDTHTTTIELTIKYPHYTITKQIVTFDNISVDIYDWDIYIGTIIINALKSEELTQQFSSVVEQTEQYFSRREFIEGIKYEIEKLLLFDSQICRIEQVIISGLKYISELKNIGLYN